MELKSKQRLFLSLFFFLSGFCFATWTSRIPTIKSNFGFNDAELGTALLFLPVSSLIGLPISGWLVSRFESRKPLTAGFTLFVIALAIIGLADSTFLLVTGFCLFGFSSRIFNIAVNTQAIALQKQFDKKINGSFHGLWSTGGIVGVGFSTLMVGIGTGITTHFLIVAGICIVAPLISYGVLLKNDRSPSGNKLQLAKPDPYMVYLGLLGFCAALCEGGMFDWSGIYFREVVREDLFTLGYLLFMICMATSRFASDFVIDRLGMPVTFILSSLLIVSGISLSVIFPTFWPSIIGFCLTGLGTASVVPMTFLLAGASKKYSPGLAISIIATYFIAGMLIGPPMIGYISHAFNLRLSFLTFALAGLMIIPVSKMFFAYRDKLNTESGPSSINHPG